MTDAWGEELPRGFALHEPPGMPLLAPDGTVDRIELTPTSPNAFRLDLRRVPEFFIFGSAGCLSRLHVFAPEKTYRLTIGDGVFDANGHMIGDAPNGSVVVDLRNHKVWHVELTHGTWQLTSASGVHALQIRADVLLRGSHALKEVQIVGAPTVQNLQTEFLRLADGAVLDGQFRTEVLEAAGPVVLRGSLVTQRISTGYVRFDTSGGRAPTLELGGGAQGLSFIGGGRVTLSGTASELRFGPSDDDPQHRLPSLIVRGPEAVDIEGDLQLLVLSESGQTLRAGPDGLRSRRFEGGVHAEIDQLDPYEWVERDIRSLQSSTRFTPRLAPTALARRRAELAMDYAAGDDESVRRRRAIGFWSRLAALLAEQHAPAAVQSDVHVAAMRARRRGARRWSREWFVLHAYALIGYGDRLLQPFAWFLLTGLTAASALTWIGAGNQPTAGVAGFAKLTLRVLDAPLALFRLNVPAPPNLPGMWDTAIWTAATVANAVLIGFMVLALRRTTRLGRE